MPDINILNLYGIEVKNELKSNVVLRLKNSTSDIKMSKLLYNKLVQAANTYANVKNSNSKLAIKFGVEFEFVGTKEHICCINFSNAMTELFNTKYVDAGRYAHNDGTLWILGKDSSINFIQTNIAYPDNIVDYNNPITNLQYPFGYELSTPILDFNSKSDINDLLTVLNLIKTDLHGEVNMTCGTHIHLGITYDCDLYKQDIRDLMHIYGMMESKVFDPIVPTNRRRNRYCKHTLACLSEKYQKLSTRYCKFDVENKCKCLHFEFRQLEGTLDDKLIFNWLLLQSTIITDLINHIHDEQYLLNMSNKNIFDILFYYDFDSDFISYFIDRVIKFKSKSIQQS